MAKTLGEQQVVGKNYENIQSDYLYISEDKLKYRLIKHIDCIRKENGFGSYLGIFITSSLAVFSTDFKSIWILTPEMWKMLFAILAIISFIFLLRTIYYCLFKRVTVETIVNDLKTTDAEKSSQEGFVQHLRHFLSKDSGPTNSEESYETNHIRNIHE